MKLPALQFYPGDWRKDPGVQSLNYFDRGVWFEILCLMHESSERGKLLLNGAPMPDEALATILGLDKQILTTTLNTLLTYGVASRDEDTGALTNRRMVKDEQLRQKRTEAGKMGGNPVLVKQNTTKHLSKRQPTAQANGNQASKQTATPSSSSSVSSSSSEEKKKELARTTEPGSPRSLKLCDEEFLNELQSREAYKALNVKIIHSKMEAWCEVRKKVPTRGRLLNWLNREDPPMNGTEPKAPEPRKTLKERFDSGELQ